MYITIIIVNKKIDLSTYTRVYSSLAVFTLSGHDVLIGTNRIANVVLIQSTNYPIKQWIFPLVMLQM